MSEEHPRILANASKKKFPTRHEAEKLLIWAIEQNPGPWVEHSRVTGRAAEAIALKCRLDGERAYVSGLLHDIGYYSYRDGKGKRDHIFAGYDFMMKKGYDGIAKICLSHSFAYQDAEAIASSYVQCRGKDLAFISAFLNETEYDVYDNLIQLCDALCLPHGVVIMEKRLMDVVMRKGFGKHTLVKWEAWFLLKDYFDELCGVNIYRLFYDEILAGVFG